MKLTLLENTFNSYGGSWILRPLVSVFELEAKSFGTAIEEIQLTICFPNSLSFASQSVHRSMASSYDNFQKYLSELPKRNFFRKKKILSITSPSNFASAEQIKPTTKEEYAIRNAKYFYEYNIRALDLLTQEVKACRAKFKKTDDFDFLAFVNWLESIKNKIPTDKTDADQLIEAWQKQRKSTFEKLSEWEKLGLDWDEFHPKARKLLTDPRLWDIGHDFSPNGNDTGADILEMVREIRDKKSFLKDGGKKFYESTWDEWGFATPSQSWPDDSTDYHVHRELIVGLAFALIKLKGECPHWLHNQATKETKTYVGYLESNQLNWPHRQECLDYQALIIKALDNLYLQENS